MRRTRLALSTLGVLAALLLAVGVNLLADRLLSSARLDLTENRLYTLSPGTRQVLEGLRDPVTLRFFYSRRLGAEIPQYGAYAERVRDMLREYVAASRGMVRLELYDPEPFSETEDRAIALGLQGVPLDQGGEQVFFGVAGANLVDTERAIPFFQPERERFLEADLTRLVFELSNPEKPVLGVLSPLPLSGDPRAMMMRQPQLAQPQIVIRQLREAYTVQELGYDAQVIPPEVQVLLLAHPQNLPEAAQYAVDQFVMRGGRLIVMIDPHSEMQATRPGPTGAPPTDTASRLDRLLEAWGVEAPADQVVLDLRGAWRVRAGPNERVQAVDYVAWFNLQGDSLNREEQSTALLEQVSVASAGHLRPREGAGIEFIPLLTSSAQSMLLDAAQVRREPSPTRILAEFRADGERRVIAARIRGNLLSAFQDGPPALPEGATRPEGFPAHLARSNGPANLVVIHDSDILEDRFWVRVQEFFGQQTIAPFSNNGPFVVNLADSLSGSDAMIGLRSRGESQRPFEVVEDIRRRADAQFRQTERQLTERLQATERRLRELRQGTPGEGARNTNQVVITEAQRAEIERAREEIAATRRQLRAVQLELRRDIEALDRNLRILNIVAVPLLLTVLAIVLGLLRARRRAAARA
ncbi:Gldg family protein [Roseococcus thiosulfatophilus]|uniref:Gldg family protein n=1 Tax=Roseococcus thiosulfatophilus TaxID=35813 RepID=UPI001A8DEC03|nr:Gldg family protein [Roseococcus thiosulfatophilus]